MTLATLAALLAAPALAAPVKIAAVTAKSAYTKADVSYPAENVKDGKGSTAWFEGDPGSGVGSWIELDLGGSHNVTKIVMFAGDWSGGWAKANRPKEVEIKWSDGTLATWTLTDAYKAQIFVPPSPKATTSIRFKINSLYNGTAFPDTAISEVVVYDDQPDPNATIKSVTASTEFPADADGSYFAVQAADGVRDSFWCEGNKTSDGTGESLTFTFDQPTHITSMSVCDGMCSTSDILKKGNAPSHVTLTFSDGSTQAVDLKALMPLPQKIPLTPVTTASVKMKIDAVRKGTDFDDACISEVSFAK